jgi:hypothetical protein
MLKVLTIAVALFAPGILDVAYSQSQQPSPSAGEPTGPQQSKRQSPQQEPAADQRGTDQSPIVVKVIPTFKTDEESAQEAKDRKERTANDRELINYSRDLDILTGILAAVGLLQLMAFGFQARYMQQSAKEMRKTTEAAEAVSKDQIAHSHKVERAYMSCGGVPARRRQEEPGTDGGIVVRLILTGEFEVHVNNHGKTTGEFTQIAIGFCDAANIPPEPIYNPEPFHDWIGPGTQSRPMVWKKIDPPNASAVYGRIYYRDIFGELHDSGFLQDIRPDGTTTALKGPPAYTTSN